MDIKTIKGSLTNRSDVLNAYLREISKYPLLSPDEETDLIHVMRENKSLANEAREKLINCNQRFVFAIAKRYASDDTVMDLIDEGNIGLIIAIEKYDETVGVRFLSYAIWYIRRSIHFFLANDNLLIKRTNNMKIGTKIGKIKNAYYCKTGRYPSEDEIIDSLQKEFNITIQKQSDVYEISSESINDYLEDEENTLEKTQFFSEKTASYNDYEEQINCEYNKELVTKLLNTLNERDREIMKMAFGIGYNKEFTNYEIGDELGLSSERVRQIINKIREKLSRMVSYVTI